MYVTLRSVPKPSEQQVTNSAPANLSAATSAMDEGVRTPDLDDGLRQLVNWLRAERAREAAPAGAIG